MINNIMKIAQMAPLFKQNISKELKINKDTNISNTLKNNLNTNNFSKLKLIKIYNKGLNIYINNLNTYKLESNNKNLIATIKNKPLNRIDLPLSNVNKNIKIETNNEKLKENSIPLVSVNLNKNNIHTIKNNINNLKNINNNIINKKQNNLLKNNIEVNKSINNLNLKDNNLIMKDNKLNLNITEKENKLLLNQIVNKTITANKEKQEFFNNIELMIKYKKETELNKGKDDIKALIKNLNLNSKSLTDTDKTNNITDTINNTKNISNYLKSISIFNSIPRGKLFTFSQQLSYNFNTINNKLIKKMYTFLFYSFYAMNSLISKPILEITTNKVIIHLFFFQFDFNNFYSKSNNKKTNFNSDIRNNSFTNKLMETESDLDTKKNFINKNYKKLNIICKILSIYFKKPVELQLVKLNYPYLDSNIFVNLLALMINNKKIRTIMKKFFRFAVIKNIAKLSGNVRISKIPSFLSGIKIKIAGRLLTQRVIPRKTVKVIRRGAYARGKVNFLDIARYTSKNKRGAFSITVTTGQNIII